MKAHYPLLIIGAGPAGLSAAIVAAEHGLDVAVIDDQAAPGGQIYRAIESISPERIKQLGGDYQRGHELVAQFRASSAEYHPHTSVWSLNDRQEIGILTQDQTRIITADHVLLANGAMERPIPFKGWTLPGVMNAGAGQVMFKQAGIIPEDGVVMAGSGPLLLLLAWQYLHAGVKIRALLDTSPYNNLLRALPHLPRALMAHHYITRGLHYQNMIKLAGVPIIKGVSRLSAHGDNKLEKISYRRHGKTHEIETDLLLVHFGVVPQTHLSRAAGCRHSWDNNQQCLRPQLDEWGATSQPGLFIAGDNAGIGGARTAEHAGRLAAFQVLFQQGIIDQAQRDREANKDRKWMRDDLHIRPFLEKLFRHPWGLLAKTDDDTIVCRCEEITAGQIRAEFQQGHSGSNQVKFITRSGMGPCQGRQCMLAVAHILANESNQPMHDDAFYKVRPPVTPLTLGQLASLYPEEQE